MSTGWPRPSTRWPRRISWLTGSRWSSRSPWPACSSFTWPTLPFSRGPTSRSCALMVRRCSLATSSGPCRCWGGLWSSCRAATLARAARGRRSTSQAP
eukprot:7491230-Pyramimonas_sp.AAC.1